MRKSAQSSSFHLSQFSLEEEIENSSDSDNEVDINNMDLIENLQITPLESSA